MSRRFYSGQRIYFRALERDDAQTLVGWFNDPQNWVTLDRSLPMNVARETEFIDNLYKTPSDVVLGIVRAADDELVGVTGLQHIDPTSRRALFGIVIGRAYQGQGFGSEAVQLMARYAFNELNLNRIHLTVYAFNQRGIRAYERAGFVREGCARQAKWRNGAFHDELHYGLLREDYEARERDSTEDDVRLASMAT